MLLSSKQEVDMKPEKHPITAPEKTPMSTAALASELQKFI